MVKNLSATHRQCRFDPWVGKVPWRRKWQPTPVFCLENPMDRGAWWATVHEVAELDTTERLSRSMSFEDKSCSLGFDGGKKKVLRCYAFL